MIPLLLAAATTACAAAQVVVRNQSTSQLGAVAIVANEIRGEVGDIDPQSERGTRFCPRGEAGAFQIEFTVDGVRHHSRHDVYFECHNAYLIEVEISRTLDVKSKVSLR